jgi:hypothetical protein
MLVCTYPCLHLDEIRKNSHYIVFDFDVETGVGTPTPSKSSNELSNLNRILETKGYG